MCVDVDYLTFDILLLSKSEQKVTGNQLCSPIIFLNLLKTDFSLRNILTTIFVGGVWIVSYISNSKNKLLMDYQRLLVYKNKG